jgi:GT2 family glycosyltransferase
VGSRQLVLSPAAGRNVEGPLVSVITPGRFRLSTLSRCVESVQAQTYAPIEHLLLSDGSDEFFALASEFAARLPGVWSHLVAPPPPEVTYVPARLARVRNEGVQRARGEFVAFLDDDNTWEPEHIASLVAVLERDPTLRAAYSYRRLWNDDGSPYVTAVHPWNNARTDARARYQELLELGMYVPGTNLVRDQVYVQRDGAPFPLCSVDASAWLVRREIALAFPFRTEFSAAEMADRQAEDTALCLRLCAAGVSVATSGLHTLNYYLGGFSTTAGGGWHL